MTSIRQRPEPSPRTSTATATMSALLIDELAAAAEPELLAADERLVDLDRARQRLPVRIDHRPAQLVEDEPGRRVARQPEHVSELESRQPGACGRSSGRPPRTRSRSDVRVRCRIVPAVTKDLVGARLALPGPPARQDERVVVAAARAAEPIGPAAGSQIVEARLLVGEAPVELRDRSRVRRTGHPTTLPPLTVRSGNDHVNWPHRDHQNWPHLRPVS